jgi:hypothetical protein
VIDTPRNGRFENGKNASSSLWTTRGSKLYK